MDNFENKNTEENLSNSYSYREYEKNQKQYEDVEFTKVDGTPIDKKKDKKRSFPVIVLVIITAIIGGMIGSGAMYFIMKQTPQTITPNYAPPSFASTEGALTPAEAFTKVAPAVVIVSTKSLQSNGFFQQEVEGIGSGFIIDEEGHILTNYHVVKGATEVTVTLSDKREVKGKVINYDEAQDVAMLKLEDGVKVPAVAELGDSDGAYPGEQVIAIGTPLSKDFYQTVTLGIVSAVNRTVNTETGTSLNLIQTDTAINPGNSGGPLVNSKGQVIGINTMKISGGAENIGFAIPINDVKSRIESLSKPIINLGVKVRDITEELSKQTDLPVGVYVADVIEFSAAEKAGMKIGDVIVEFDGKKIKSFDDLKKAKEGKNAGDVVKVDVMRNGKKVTLDMTLSN